MTKTTAFPVGTDVDEFIGNQAGGTVRTLKSAVLGLLGFPVKIATGASNAQLTLDANAGVARLVSYTTAGLSRWTLFADTVAESGGNVGSDLRLERFDDTGASLGVALIISRKTGTLKIPPVVVASLPSASVSGNGARHFVSDASATTFASVVAGSGANGVPVYSDGTNWRIG